MDPRTLQFLKGYQPGGDFTPEGPAKPVGPSGLTGFLTRNLNSLGAGGGGLAGGAAGAAVGTAILPGVGTVLGGLIGAGLGGAGGGAAGEALKEKGLSQDLNANEIGKQALIGGGSELGGAGLGELVGLARGAKAVTPVTDALENFANKKIASQVAEGLPSQALKSSGDVGKLYEASDLFRNVGLYNNADREAAARLVTGKTGVVNGIKQSILSHAGEVPVLDSLNNMGSTIQKAIAENAVSGAADKKAVLDAVRAQAQKALGSKGAIGSMSVDAPTAFKMQQALEQQAADLIRTKPEMANALRDVAREVGAKIDLHGGTNVATAAFQMTPEATQSLTDRAVRTLGKSKGTSLSNYVVDAVNGAKTLPDLRAIEAPFVQASKSATGSTIAGLTGGAPSLIESAAPAAVSPFGKLGAVRALIRRAAPLEAAGAGGLARLTGNVGPMLGNLASGAARMAPEAVRTIGNEQQTAQAAQTAPDASQASSLDQTAPGTTDTSASGSTADTSQGSDQTDPNNPFSQSVLQAMALHDIQTTGGKNIDKIATLNNLFGTNSPSAKAAAKGGATTGQKTQELNSRNALGQLDNIEQSLQTAGGAKGFVGGHLADNPVSNALNLNPSAKSYNQTLVDAVTAYAKAVTGSSRPAASVIKQFITSFPQLTDSPDVAAQKLKILRNNVQGNLSNSTNALTGVDLTNGGGQ